MGDPADRAAEGEQGEGRVGGQAKPAGEGGQGHVDVRRLAGQRLAGGHQPGHLRIRTKGREQRLGARIAGGIGALAEPGRRIAPGDIGPHRRLRPVAAGVLDQRRDPGRHPAVARTAERRQAGQHRGGKRGSRGGRHPGGEGRGVQLMVRQQHQRAAHQVGLLLAQPPGAGQPQVQRPRVDPLAQGAGKVGHQTGPLSPKGGRSAPERRRLAARPRRQGGEGPGRERAPKAHARSRLAGEHRRIPAAPEQQGGLFQRQAFGQRRRVGAAIIQPSAGHVGDRRGQHRLAPRDRPARHIGRLAPRRLAFEQARDVVGAIEALAGIGGIGPRLDAAAADIGVEGLRLDREPGDDRRSIEPGIRHIDRLDQD